jgi:hypothetical protein
MAGNAYPPAVAASSIALYVSGDAMGMMLQKSAFFS